MCTTAIALTTKVVFITESSKNECFQLHFTEKLGSLMRQAITRQFPQQSHAIVFSTIPGCGLTLGCVYWSLGDSDSGVSEVCLTVTFTHMA